MRIVSVTVASLIASLILFMTVKFWGQSQRFMDYNHSFYKSNQLPVIFEVASTDKLKFTEQLKSGANLFLNVATTQDQKLVLIKPDLYKKKEVRSKKFTEIENEVLLLEPFKSELQNKKLIFNITENAIAGHEIFLSEIKNLNLDKGENVLVMSPYDVMTKSIKELAPTFVYGTSQPEILRIKAMESMFLIEAATYRADVIVYPLTYYKQEFFTEALQSELHKRFTRIIVGPINQSNLVKATEIKPFGIVLERD